MKKKLNENQEERLIILNYMKKKIDEAIKSSKKSKGEDWNLGTILLEKLQYYMLELIWLDGFSIGVDRKVKNSVQKRLFSHNHTIQKESKKGR